MCAMDKTTDPKMLVFVVLLYNCFDYLLVHGHGLTPSNVGGFYGRNASKLCRWENNQVLGEWICRDAGKVHCEKLCDGVVDCVDGSDETPLSCGEVSCKETAFRCDYGGCIAAELECNGLKNCVDGSDEKTINCPWGFNKTKCNEGFFQCKNGDCIHEDGVCNGRVDCRDRSDETEELCEAHFCPREAFRCNYGACVGPSARCNGKQDCADGSDERVNSCKPSIPNFHLLFKIEPRIDPKKLANYPGHSLTNPQKEDQDISKYYRELILSQELEIGKLRKINIDLQLFSLERNCNATEQLQNNFDSLDALSQTKDTVDKEINKIFGHSRSLKGNCLVPVIRNGHVINNNQETYDHGKSVVNGTKLTFRCKLGNHLIGSEESECMNGKLLNEPPVCTKMCSGISLDTLTVQADCFAPNGVSIPCSPLLPPDTTAILRCKIGYKNPDRTISDVYKCQRDGNWNAHIYKCDPICGEIAQGHSLIVGGTVSNITEVPWHVGIYEAVHPTGNMQQICGGSIISATAVLSAAHCFWDRQQGVKKKAELYRVAVGKTLRDFDANERMAQKYQVKSIHNYEAYRNYDGLFHSDIAVLKLKESIIFQSYIKPICMDFDLKGNQRYVKSGIEGRVAGWGYTVPHGNSSAVLKILDMPTVDYHTCYNESPQSFKDFITTDKFCGGFTNGESVCTGDSGGGFAIPRPSGDGSNMIYFLRGIVSVSPNLDGFCDNTKYSGFTDVSLHTLFIQEHITS